MASSYLQRPDEQPGERRRRTGSMLLAVAAHVLVILLLLYLTPVLTDRERAGSALKTFQVAGERTSSATKHAKAVPHHTASAPAPRAKPWAQPSRLHTEATPDADAAAIWALGKGMYKGSDIAAIPSADKGETEVADAAGGGGAGKSKGAGAGPGGAADAEWYREPSEAEMRTYVPHQAVPGNWGMIVCQTAPNYRVENCRELQQSPPGIGISRALRQASFQFKVRPPVVDGKPMIGAWVRIRFYIVDGGMSLHR